MSHARNWILTFWPGRDKLLTDGLLDRDDSGAGSTQDGGDGVAAWRGHRGGRPDHHVSGAARANRDKLRLALGIVNDGSHLLHRVASGVDGRHDHVLRLLNRRGLRWRWLLQGLRLRLGLDQVHRSWAQGNSSRI